ncbi:penicillin-binding transpeptidase domain-containing protein [Lacihabitans lacunae]|uniref:Penicillin-binding transpeptidase domain-containing protein n=1 Tax=Lacihabitans lacunae TaxID=1028214 RepID=A0ABV7YZC2_9BACT
MSAIKEQFKNRSNIIVAVIIFVALLIFAKIIYLQTSRKDELLAKVADIQRKERIIHATRGNIYASDGKSLLATSIPKYITIFDPSQAKSKIFEENIDSLSFLLSRFFGDMGRLEYKEKITKARKKRSRYLVLGGRRVDHIEKMEIENFPLFREGANKGGGRFETKDFRFLPFNNLASRTIGKLDRKHGREGAFGIEASFDNYLSGKDGKGFYERMAGGVYKPVNSESDIDSEPGLDVVTTIDVNFQDIVESALKNQVFKTQAKYGTAVIMEVATGEIKAIANLTRITSNNEIRYIEDQNYAVIGGTDPGSTFKLASMAALLEKTNLNIDDFGVNCPGEIKHNGLSFTCSHEHGNLTIRQIFEQSCNIGIYTLMKKHFGFTTSSDYYEYLQEFKLDKPSGFQLKGEPYPLLKNTKSATFSSTTVPWMSIGYESRITPIQMMTFYNAIANDGVWVQPIIVKEIRQGNVTIEKLEANRISSPICSEKTIKKVKLMMEGVVNNGTAKNVKEGICSIAGKTGTSQKRVTGNYKKGMYYTSFIGYFPANSPKYTCIVVIDEPQGANLFGGDVSAPVFRTIADKVFAYDISMHPLAITKANKENLAAHHGVGKSQDHRVISDKLGLKTAVEKDGFAKTYRTSNDSLAWKSTNPDKNIEELMGMSLKDALPLLENKGYRVKYSGFGKVRGYSFVGKNIVALVLK